MCPQNSYIETLTSNVTIFRDRTFRQQLRLNEIIKGLSRQLWGEESACQCMIFKFSPWVKKIPRRMTWQPTPVFLPGKIHRQMSLVSYSTWGRKESDVTEQLSTHAGDHKDMSSNLIGLVVLYEEEERDLFLSLLWRTQ